MAFFNVKNCDESNLAGGWTTHPKHMLVELDHFGIGVKIIKKLSCHQQAMVESANKKGHLKRQTKEHNLRKLYTLED